MDMAHTHAAAGWYDSGNHGKCKTTLYGLNFGHLHTFLPGSHSF